MGLMAFPMIFLMLIVPTYLKKNPDITIRNNICIKLLIK